MIQSHTTGSDEPMSDLPPMPEPWGYVREVDGRIQISVGPVCPECNQRGSGHFTPWAAMFGSDHVREYGLAALSQSPAAEAVVPCNYIDFQQKRGALADIIDEALAAHAQWLLDDDYDAQGAMQRIMDRMRERRALYLSPNQPAAIEPTFEKFTMEKYVPLTYSNGLPPVAAQAMDGDFIAAVNKLVFMARTSGGTAGRDDDLCKALDAVETHLRSQPSQPAAGAQGDVTLAMQEAGHATYANGGTWADVFRAMQAASAQPIQQKPVTLSRQEVINKFRFLEGACSEGTYREIVDVVMAMAPQRSTTDSDVRDAARFRWLTEDHDDLGVREKCREILSRMGVMSYSAACMSIDANMQSSPSTGQAGERE